MLPAPEDPPPDAPIATPIAAGPDAVGPDAARSDAEGLDAARLRAELARTAPSIRHFAVLRSTGSTNDDVAARLAALPDPRTGERILLAAEHQSAGRGRFDRPWRTPPGASLLMSLGAVTDAGPGALPWYSLIAAAETARVLGALVPGAAVKWPNDVVVPVRDDGAGVPLGADPSGRPYRKVAGILARAVPGRGVVVGIGLNVHQDRSELPVATAASLATAGVAAADRDRTTLLARLAAVITGAFDGFEGSGSDAGRFGHQTTFREICVTLGRDVEVTTGDGSRRGRAVDLTADGGLVLDADGERVALAAGDVRDLRRSTG